MHLTLKKEATRPAGRNFLQQQAKFDRFIHDFNFERPHQAIDMKYPAELYSLSPRPYQGLGELEYPFHDRTIVVTSCGRICIGRRKVNLSHVFAGQKVGIKEVSEKIWLVTFMHYDLGVRIASRNFVTGCLTSDVTGAVLALFGSCFPVERHAVCHRGWQKADV
jgi:hypothetical protein